MFSFDYNDCFANTCHADLSETGWCLDWAASSPPRPGFHREIREPRHSKWTDKSPEIHFFATMKQPVRLCLTEWIQAKVIDLSNALPCQNKQTKVTIEDLAKEHSQTSRKNKGTRLKWSSNTLPYPTTNKSEYQTPCHRAQPHAERFLEQSVRWYRVRLAAAPQPPWGIYLELCILRQRTS